MALNNELIGERIYLDTNIIIYAVEEPVPLTAGQLALFAAIDDGSIEALTSELTLAECLVRPFSTEDARLTLAYELFLGSDTKLELVPIDRKVLIAAAHFRAFANLRLPDAIHIATARDAGAAIFLTADKRLRAPSSLQLKHWNSL
jgi:predicted nucleic acid-binding protein